jgi:ArsR family transcriptional regulator, nickel/cobalt-responsive transcriptional repressor
MGHGVEGSTKLAVIDAEAAREVAEAMQALSTASRVRILARLREGACSVGELAEAVGMEQSAVSQQLRVLRHLRLVVGERSGRNVLYALHDSHVGVLLEEAANHVAHLRLDYAQRMTERTA